MTINDILNLEPEQIIKLKRNELSKIVSKAASTANKRIKRLKNNNLITPALISVEKSGGNFSVKNKNINQLRSEYSRVSAFLKAKTSTVKGAKQVQKEIEERIGGKLSPSQTKDFWEAYRKVDELEPNFLQMYGSQRMQQFIRNELVKSNKNVDELIKDAINEINLKYEIEMEDNDDDLGEFFEF